MAMISACVDPDSAAPPEDTPGAQVGPRRPQVVAPESAMFAAPSVSAAFAAAHPDARPEDRPSRIRITLPHPTDPDRQAITVALETADGRSIVTVAGGAVELPRLVVADGAPEANSTFAAFGESITTDLAAGLSQNGEGERGGLALIPCVGYWAAVNTAAAAAASAITVAIAELSTRTALQEPGGAARLKAAQDYARALKTSTALFAAYYIKLAAWLGSAIAVNLAAQRAAIGGVPGAIVNAAVDLTSGWLGVVVLKKQIMVIKPAMTLHAGATGKGTVITAHSTYVGAVTGNLLCTMAIAGAFWANAGLGVAFGAMAQPPAPGGGGGGGGAGGGAGGPGAKLARPGSTAVTVTPVATALDPFGGGPAPHWITDLWTAMPDPVAAADAVDLDLDRTISPYNGAPMYTSAGFDRAAQAEYARADACFVMRVDRNNDGPYDVFDLLWGVGSFRLQEANAEFNAGSSCSVGDDCDQLTTSMLPASMFQYQRVCDGDDNNDGISDVEQGLTNTCEDGDGDGLEDLLAIVADTYDRTFDQGGVRSCSSLGLDLNLHYQDGQHPTKSVPQLMAENDQREVRQEYVLITTVPYRDLASGEPIGRSTLRVSVHGKLRRPADPCYVYEFVYAPPWSPEAPGRWKWIWNYQDTANQCDSGLGGGPHP